MTIKTPEQTFYQTADLALATIISLSFPIESIDKENPRKANFCFRRSSELDGLVEAYWRGQLKVEPQSYFSALRAIKARLYDE